MYVSVYVVILQADIKYKQKRMFIIGSRKVEKTFQRSRRKFKPFNLGVYILHMSPKYVYCYIKKLVDDTNT